MFYNLVNVAIESYKPQMQTSMWDACNLLASTA